MITKILELKNPYMHANGKQFQEQQNKFYTSCSILLGIHHKCHGENIPSKMNPMNLPVSLLSVLTIQATINIFQYSLRERNYICQF